MTLEQFLKLEPDKQSLEVSKWQNPKPWKHDIANNARGTYTGLQDWCTKCKTGPVYDGESEAYPFKKTRDNWVQVGCSIPDPIKIDWNLAKRLQGEVFDLDSVLVSTLEKTKSDDKLRKSLARVFHLLNLGFTFSEWQRTFCTPSQWIAACMQASNFFKGD